MVCFSLVCNLQGVLGPSNSSQLSCLLPPPALPGPGSRKERPRARLRGDVAGPGGQPALSFGLANSWAAGNCRAAANSQLRAMATPHWVGEDRRMCGTGCLSMIQGTENGERLANCTGLEAAFSSEGWSWCLCPSGPVAFPLSAPVLLKSPRPRGCQTVPAEAAAFSCSPSTFCGVPKLPGIFQRQHQPNADAEKRKCRKIP